MIRAKSMQSVLFVMLTLALLVATANAEVTYYTVALAGDPAPGAGEGVTFKYLSDALINNAGQVVFLATLEGPGVDDTNDRGIWFEDAGTMVMVAREGEQAPGTENGVTFKTIGTPRFNNSGQTAFSAILAGPGVDSTNFAGIWSGFPGELTLVVRTGEQVPGAPEGVRFRVVTGWHNALINDAGQITLNATLTGPGVDRTNDDAICLVSDGQLSVLAREGGQVPDMADGIYFFSIYGPLLGGVDQVAFWASLIPHELYADIWIGGAELLGRSMFPPQPANGEPEGVMICCADPEFAMNTAGQIAMQTYLTGPGIDNSSDLSICAGSPDSLTKVVRAGEQPPGIEDGVEFYHVGFPELGGGGHVVFTGAFKGPGRIPGSGHTGMWSNGSGTLELIARQKEHAPGTPDGVFFGNLVYDYPDIAINAVGQVALQTRLYGEGVNNDNDMGIWATDRQGNLTLIVREGEWLEVAPGDFQFIKYLRWMYSTGGEEGYGRQFNDSGQLVFSSSTAGVFVASLPEPDPDILLSELIETVNAIELSNGTKNALTAKLQTALQKLDDQNDVNNIASVNQLEAFINAVEAQRDKHIPGEEADALIAAAEQIIALIKDGN